MYHSEPQNSTKLWISVEMPRGLPAVVLCQMPTPVMAPHTYENTSSPSALLRRYS